MFQQHPTAQHHRGYARQPTPTTHCFLDRDSSQLYLHDWKDTRLTIHFRISFANHSHSHSFIKSQRIRIRFKLQRLVSALTRQVQGMDEQLFSDSLSNGFRRNPEIFNPCDSVLIVQCVKRDGIIVVYCDPTFMLFKVSGGKGQLRSPDFHPPFGVAPVTFGRQSDLS